MRGERGFNPERASGETGRLYEERLFGKPNLTQEFWDREAKLPRNERGHYRNDNDIYRLVSEYQENEEGEPVMEQFAIDLADEVRDALGLTEEEADSVTFNTSVQTPIDGKMGVDAWFEFADPSTGRTVRVTLDTTLNPRKLEENEPKADMFVGELPDAVQEEDRYFEAVERIGHEIAARLQKRILEAHGRPQA